MLTAPINDALGALKHMYNTIRKSAARRPILPPHIHESRPMNEGPGITYRDAGVDIDAGDELVERIKPLVKRTQRPEVLAGIGGFGALVELPAGRYQASRAGFRHRWRRHKAARSRSTRAGTTPSASISSPCARTTSSCRAPSRSSSSTTTPPASCASTSRSR